MLVFGATSMVGSHYVQHTGFSVHAAGRSDPARQGLAVERFSRVDIQQLSHLQQFIRSAPEKVMINFAARTDVDQIELERRDDSPTPDSGEAWSVNALAPGAMALAARQAGKYFVQVSTDFVFDGTAGPYHERARRSPLTRLLSWYGWTKSEGERRVRTQDPSAGILRISYPYGPLANRKRDFIHGMMDRFRTGSLPPLYSDQQLTPTWVPDLPGAINALVRSTGRGVFHLASPVSTTPYELGARLACRKREKNVAVQPGSLKEVLSRPGMTPRPIKGGLVCDRLPEMGVPITNWKDGLDQIVKAEGWS